MKRLLFTFIFTILYFVGQSQTNWQVCRTYLNAQYGNGLICSNYSGDAITLWNYKYSTDYTTMMPQCCNATIRVNEEITKEIKKISFSIESHITGNPKNHSYAAFDKDGNLVYTQDLYWGYKIYFDNNFYIEAIYHKKGSSQKQVCVKGYLPNMGRFNKDWSNVEIIPKGIVIDMFNNDKCRISTPFLNNKDIEGLSYVKNIDINIYSGVKLSVYDFKIEKECNIATQPQSQINPHKLAGDRYYEGGDYHNAMLAYTKAIESGYKNYEIYIRRATSFIEIEYYNNAIEDLTCAISYKPTVQAFLLRGKLKLQKNDPSFVDDLIKGGIEGSIILKELGVDPNTPLPLPPSQNSSEYTSSGSGMVLTTNGIIITNYHVVENAQKIDVFIKRNNDVAKYKAKVLISDKQNDLTLLKIDDATFVSLPTLPYAVKTSILDVGTSVFALGYPMSNTLGEELKVTDGIISSKTGYQGDIVTYQISAPIQPGNSGGPLFDKQGYLVGITNAGVPDAQNVGYAIKILYLRNLVDTLSEPFTLPSNNTISGLSFTEKIKKISPYVVLIKVK